MVTIFIKSIFKRLDNRFFIYVIFASLATLLDIIVLYILKDFIKFHYLLATAIGYISGMFLSYSLNKIYNFRNQSRKVIRQFGLFMFVSGIGLGLTQIIIWVFVEFINFDVFIAKLFSIFVVFFWSFYGHKKITFNLLK